MKNHSIWNYFRPFHPLFLLGGILLYSLGAGIARYLGYSIDWSAYLWGQICVTCLQLFMVFVPAYFDTLQDSGLFEKVVGLNGFGFDPTLDDGNGFSQKTHFTLLVAILILGIFSIAMLIINGNFNAVLAIILLFSFLLLGVYGRSLVRFSGYGELIQSFLMANIFPTLSFLVQTGDFHRLVLMVTFPITLIYLAMLLVGELPHYQHDLSLDRLTISVVLGWQNGVRLHNLLILGAYLLISVSALLGVPWILIWPEFLSLPFAFLQIWFLNRLADGDPPRWQVHTFLSATLFILMVYMVSFSFWIH